MYERFTDRARLVVRLAQEEARMLDHNWIGTEHQLLGILHEGESVAAKALEALGVTLETTRAKVEELVGRGQSAPSGHIPFTPRAKKVLELSLREALQLAHADIGPEHILLGIVREGKGVAAGILAPQKPDGLTGVRQEILKLLSEGFKASGRGSVYEISDEDAAAEAADELQEPDDGTTITVTIRASDARRLVRDFDTFETDASALKESMRNILGAFEEALNA